jgi:hypothetical protein
VDERQRLNRLRTYILVLTICIVFGAIAGPILVVTYVSSVANQNQLNVTCQILEAEVDQLTAIRRNGILLEEIAHKLGLPIVPPPEIVIPEVPPECDGS